MGSRAGAAVEEIYDDLQNHIESVRSIPSDRRSALAKQVQELYDVCRMASVFCSHSSEKADLRGSCGYSIGSREYRSYIERKVFAQDLPAMSSDDYDGALRDALANIAQQLQRDLARNERENNYITDETARTLLEAASELGRCGVSVGFADSAIGRLAWFVGGDPDKIRRLQSKLNEFGVGEHLTEDGVYGKKTDKAVEHFFDQLRRGSFPTIAYLDPLQSKSTQIYSRPSPSANGVISSLHDLSARSRNKKGDITVFRADIPDNAHPFYHINTVEGRSIKDGKYVPTSRQLEHLNKWNHTQISDDTYKLLKNFDGVAKKVRIGGTVLLVAGEALDIIELCKTIEPQLQSADRKLDKKTWSSIASIGGSWIFSAVGSKAGATAGAAIGTAIMPGVGTAIGGVTGSIILGTLGSMGGDWLGRWVVDITVLEE